MRYPAKTEGWRYFLLAARVLLIWTLFGYGWAKLTGNQFGVDNETMNRPLKEIDLFRLSWYLADHQPFKAFIGLSQIATALLLTVNRTVIIGAFISIPIWLNVLVWDITFMNGLTTAFTFRLSFYLILTLLIIYYNKSQVVPAIKEIVLRKAEANYPFWAYLLLPVAAMGIELIGAIPHIILQFLKSLGK